MNVAIDASVRYTPGRDASTIARSRMAHWLRQQLPEGVHTILREQGGDRLRSGPEMIAAHVLRYEHAGAQMPSLTIVVQPRPDYRLSELAGVQDGIATALALWVAPLVYRLAKQNPRANFGTLQVLSYFPEIHGYLFDTNPRTDENGALRYAVSDSYGTTHYSVGDSVVVDRPLA